MTKKNNRKHMHACINRYPRDSFDCAHIYEKKTLINKAGNNLISNVNIYTLIPDTNMMPP